MGLKLGRILRLMACLLGTMLILWGAGRAEACWNIAEAQCFLDPCSGTWPWEHPTNTGRVWRRSPNPPATGVTWGCQTQYFDTHLCPDDPSALWCAGANNTTQQYPPNLDDYVTYGPLNMQQAVAEALATFYLYDRTEADHDSVFWGAARTQDLAIPDCMYVSGSHSGIMENGAFEPRTIDLAHLRNAVTGDSASLLESPVVYFFWRFKSDSNTVTDAGAFIDNVIVEWEDTCRLELAAMDIGLLRTDGTPWTYPLFSMDTAYASFTWGTCASSVVYPSYRVMGFVDSVSVLDTVILAGDSGSTHTVDTQPWVMTPDTHRVWFTLDTLHQVAECGEGEDNHASRTFIVYTPPPPVAFVWVTPGDSIVYGDQSVMLRWEAYQSPSWPTTVSFFYGNDTLSCLGLAIPGGTDLPARNGPDSLVWDLHTFTNGRVLHPYVRIHNALHDTCLYAPHPVIRRSLTADDADVETPEHYYLSQNYPNPFNPSTELRYGVAKAGHVTLTVFDVLGREAEMLVNDHQAPGNYRLSFDGSRLPSGLYFCKLTTPEGTETRKMMLMK